MKKLDRTAILNYIESKGFKDKLEFAKTLTRSKKKVFVFNKRFFEGWTFLKLAQSMGICDAMTGHHYRDMITLVEQSMYRDMKKEFYRETGLNQDIELAWLPLSKRLRGLLSEYTYLHEVCNQTEIQFWDSYGCGDRTFVEVLSFLNFFGLKFKDDE